MLVHASKDVDEPLAGYVVADDNQAEGVGVDQKCVEDDREDIVHVAISV